MSVRYKDMPESGVTTNKKLHMHKAKCLPSITAWTNDVGMRWGGGMNLPVAKMHTPLDSAI